MDLVEELFTKKVILVTGACGTIGQEIIRQLLEYKPTEIRALDNNESELFMLKLYHNDILNTYIGDIRDEQIMNIVVPGVDIILHCAGLKHVLFYEYQPFEAVQTNIIGVKNIITAALNNKVSRVIFTSSDKAVNPTNVMGTSKLMGERLITAANVIYNKVNQIFSSVRFGNVVGSRGSVFQVFHDQISKGGPVTVTDLGMTRFIMSIRRASQLVLKAAALARGGEVMVTKMAALSINDLAETMIELLAPYYGFAPSSIDIEIIGLKPGEKLYEELMSLEEVPRSQELEDMFVVLPAARSYYQSLDYQYPYDTKPVMRPYISSEEPLLGREEIKKFLLDNHLLPSDFRVANP